jgi:hypothetical protein
VKRFVVLLILVAGGLAAAAFAVPTNAASVNGVSISQQKFNSDLHAIAKSSDYQCFLNAEEAVGSDGESTLPSVSGTSPIGEAGSNPTVTAAYAANYLNTVVAHQVVFALAASRHLAVTPADLATGRQELTGQMTSILSEVAQSKFACTSGGAALSAKEILATMPASFVDANVKFDATVSVLEEDLAGVGSSEADFQRYFTNHASNFDKTCFSVAEYTSETDANAAAAQVTSGTPFSTVAAAAAAADGVSAQQQCYILSEVAASLPAGNLESLPLNTVSSPIADGSNYILVEIVSKTPVSYGTARTAVVSAIQSAGAAKASKAISAAEKAANISVDRRYGQWSSSRAEVLPPASPTAVDVLNPAVNGTGAATSAVSTATGQSS